MPACEMLDLIRALVFFDTLVKVIYRKKIYNLSKNIFSMMHLPKYPQKGHFELKSFKPKNLMKPLFCNTFKEL
jgi:hypothetical protein